MRECERCFAEVEVVEVSAKVRFFGLDVERCRTMPRSKVFTHCGRLRHCCLTIDEERHGAEGVEVQESTGQDAGGEGEHLEGVW